MKDVQPQEQDDYDSHFRTECTMRRIDTFVGDSLAEDDSAFCQYLRALLRSISP